MDLLFGKTGQNFSHELKDALGFIDIDLPERKIKPDIRTATRELINVIGNTTYVAIVTQYNLADDDVTKNKTLVSFAQTAVAASAYALFAPINDLAHTSNGRRMRSSDDEKTPFEWMVANSDDELQKRAFRAIDDLIKYMDESFTTWKASAEYIQSYKLFIRTTAEFNQFYIIDSRLLLLKLNPGINNCEQREIIVRIGKTLFDTLKAKRNGTNAVEMTADEKLLFGHIQEACAYYALSWAIPRLQINLMPEGNIQKIRSERSTIKGRIVPAGMEVSQTSMLFKNDAELSFREIESLMKKINPPTSTTEVDDCDDNPYGNCDDDLFVNT